ncbi:nuclear transport factor 2 family protein [Chitinophaga sp. LS1]|uniref:nuclear transport factor 2 family protein n=1 Tax=Chitinophaga sp. LS1 TaxID=3051176 RepID=UPI002AABFFF0|nr:nuclear transport factor 2 family protein [Chitinophaga sp. LS1]WPV70522.1 nuclear transport factor 2 family protein [Chitinophaga sp. LS1]
MNLPKVIADLVHAQDSFDSIAYTNCFSETAVVYDEGNTHTGKKEIQQWITEANRKYKTTMNPIAYKEKGAASLLTAELSGTFPGSPIVLHYHCEITDGLISSLRITS